MSLYTKSMYTIENHPFDIYIPEYVKYLIIGTFPTNIKNLEFQFYYSGKGNYFWKIMESVFDYKFKFYSGEDAVIERKAFLSNRKIGITDMHEKCYRKNGLSSDESLFVITLRDIFLLLKKHETIDTLILTSRTEVIGALGLLKTYFMQKDIELKEPQKQGKILITNFTFNGRTIDILVPYSPSPRVIGNNKTNIDEVIEMYRYCLA